MHPIGNLHLCSLLIYAGQQNVSNPPHGVCGERRGAGGEGEIISMHLCRYFRGDLASPSSDRPRR